MASAYLVGKAVQGNPGQNDATALNIVGEESDGYGIDGAPARYVYLKGVASTIVGSWVTYDEAGLSTNLATDSNAGPVAVATVASVAGEWGWYAIVGHHVCGAISGGGAAADGKVFATATDFLADDAELDDMQVIGATFRTVEGGANSGLGLSATAALATVQLKHPWFGHDVDASA